MVQEDRPQLGAGSYFARHWRGDLPLGISFWVNFVLGNLAYAALSVMASRVPIITSLWPVTWLLVLLFVCRQSLTVWGVVGTWRSTMKYPGRGGKYFAAVLTKIIMVLWVGLAVRSFVADWIPVAIRLPHAISAERSLPECTIRPLSDGRTLEISGGITRGSAEKLEAALAANPSISIIRINSSGGLVAEAVKMVNSIQQHGLSTYSDGCASAATLVFISGKERTIHEEAQLGFHAPIALLWWKGKTYSDNLVRQTMQSAGISTDFIDHVLRTPNGEMWFPTLEEMRGARVITKEDAPTKVAFGAIIKQINNLTNTSGVVFEETGSDDADKPEKLMTSWMAQTTQLSVQMNKDLESAGNPEVFSDEVLKNEETLKQSITIEIRREAIINDYHARITNELNTFTNDLCVLKISDSGTIQMRFGMIDGILRSRPQADDVFVRRLRVEVNKQRFLEFMASKFSTYNLNAGKIKFKTQPNTDEYRALTKAIADSDQSLHELITNSFNTFQTNKERMNALSQ